MALPQRPGSSDPVAALATAAPLKVPTAATAAATTRRLPRGGRALTAA
jgi:hypothetical protein